MSATKNSSAVYLSHSHTLLSSLLDLENKDIIEHSAHIYTLVRDLSILSLNQHINVNIVAGVATHAAINSTSQASAAAAAASLVNSGNNLISKWLSKIVSLLQSDVSAHQQVGLYFLGQTIRAADYAVVKTQYAMWTRILFELSRPLNQQSTSGDEMSDVTRESSSLTSVSLTALQCVHQLLCRAMLWPDVWREVSTTVVTRFINVILSYIDILLPPIEVPKQTGLPTNVVVISSIPAVRALDPRNVSALSALFSLIHDNLSRKPLNQSFRNHAMQVEVTCWRLIDVADHGFSTVPGLIVKNEQAVSLRKLVCRVLALIPHAQNMKSQQQVVASYAEGTRKATQTTIIPYIPMKRVAAESGLVIAAEVAEAPRELVTMNKIGEGTSILMHDAKDGEEKKKPNYGNSHALGAKVASANRAAQAFLNDDDHITIPTDATHPTAVSASVDPWTVAVRRTVRTITDILASTVPVDVLEEVLFNSVIRAQHVNVEPFQLPQLSLTSSFSTASATSLRLDSLFSLLRNLLTVFPSKHFANILMPDGGAGNNTQISLKQQSKTSAFSNNATVAQTTTGDNNNVINDSSNSIIAHLELVTLPSQEYQCAIPLFELLALLRAILAMESIALSTGITETSSNSRLSSLAYASVLPSLHKHALNSLRLIILAARKGAVLPYARHMSQWLTALLLKTSPTLAATSLAAAPYGSIINQQPQLSAVPSSALSLQQDEVRTLTYECMRALVSTVGVAPIYKALVDKAVPQLLADIAAYITRFMVLARDTKRIFASSNKHSTPEEDEEDEFLMIGMGARNRRKAKKQRKAELLASLPGGSYASADNDEEDVEEEKPAEKKEKEPVSSIAASTEKSLSSAFAALHSSLNQLATYKSYRATLIQDNNGHYVPINGPVSLDHSTNAALPHSVNIGLSSAVLLPVAPAFGSEAEIASQTAVTSSALSVLIAVLSSSSAPAMLSQDMRAAIDRTLLVVLLACLDPSGKPVLPIPTSILRLLYSALTSTVLLPSTQPSVLSPMLPYAHKLLSWASNHADPVLASIASHGLVTVRSLTSPSAPPPSLPASTITALNKVKESALNGTAGIAIDSQQSGASIFGGSASNTSTASNDSSFPLHLFHYQRPFEYTDVDETARLSENDTIAQTGLLPIARPAPNVILSSNDHPVNIFARSGGPASSYETSTIKTTFEEANAAGMTDDAASTTTPVAPTPAITLEEMALKEFTVPDAAAAFAQTTGENVVVKIPAEARQVEIPPEKTDMESIQLKDDYVSDDDDDEKKVTTESMEDMGNDLVDVDDNDGDDGVGLWSL